MAAFKDDHNREIGEIIIIISVIIISGFIRPNTVVNYKTNTLLTSKKVTGKLAKKIPESCWNIVFSHCIFAAFSVNNQPINQPIMQLVKCANFRLKGLSDNRRQ